MDAKAAAGGLQANHSLEQWIRSFCHFFGIGPLFFGIGVDTSSA
jgi:hypothetical protein